jgi:formylglycine-generating enzyme
MHAVQVRSCAWEWCSDGYATGYYQTPVEDPRGVIGATRRVVCGGSWVFDARLVRAAYRNLNEPSNRSDYLGSRCARVQSAR